MGPSGLTERINFPSFSGRLNLLLFVLKASNTLRQLSSSYKQRFLPLAHILHGFEASLLRKRKVWLQFTKPQCWVFFKVTATTRPLTPDTQPLLGSVGHLPFFLYIMNIESLKGWPFKVKAQSLPPEQQAFTKEMLIW